MLGRRYKGLDLRWEGLDKVNMAGNEKTRRPKGKLKMLVRGQTGFG